VKLLAGLFLQCSHEPLIEMAISVDVYVF